MIDHEFEIYRSICIYVVKIDSLTHKCSFRLHSSVVLVRNLIDLTLQVKRNEADAIEWRKQLDALQTQLDQRGSEVNTQAEELVRLRAEIAERKQATLQQLQVCARNLPLCIVSCVCGM